MEFLEKLSSVLELFLNVLEFAAIVISIFTFFFLMLNRYSHALRRILGPCGLGFWTRLRVLFICRKSQIKKRAFLEYAILRTLGCPVISSEWRSIVNEFKAFYSREAQEALVYSIPNCTKLIGTEFSEATGRYFAYFAQPKVRAAFGIQEDITSWVIRIRIEEAYATPTCLLTGLLSQYEENWEEFIKRYVSTAYISEEEGSMDHSILSEELYFTFAWLLWGPSYELEYRNYWAGLCQLSYGDESNSVPAVAAPEVAGKLRDKFMENDGRRYGALVTADIILSDKKPFYASIRSEVNPANAYFYQKIEDNDLSFGIRISDYQSCTSYKAKKYYSTAYVWILFELEEDDLHFSPEKSLAFFEHANLADRNTYRFLMETLIDKSIRHFTKIFSHEEMKGRRYRFVCAMNDRIADACCERYRALMATDTEIGRAFADRIILEPKYTPSEVFMAYDEFFAGRKLLSYEEVSLRDSATVSDLGRFYTDVYMNCFPDPDERETFDGFLGYLRYENDRPERRYHIILAKDENQNIVGGCVFNYFTRTNSGVIEFIAVRSDIQSGGIGTQIYRHVLSVLFTDARQCAGRPLDYVFCEIDSPEYSRAEIKKYLYFWDKNGYYHIDFRYVQPALSDRQNPVTGLWLTVAPQQSREKTIPAQTVLDVLYDYMHYAMEIDDPAACPEYRDAAKEMGEKDSVALLEIV